MRRLRLRRGSLAVPALVLCVLSGCAQESSSPFGSSLTPEVAKGLGATPGGSSERGCRMLPYDMLGAFLRARGVNLALTTEGSAGWAYRRAAPYLAPAQDLDPPPLRVPVTTNRAMYLFDVFLTAAPEIISGLPLSTICSAQGAPPALFDKDGCTSAGLSCLLGVPASAELRALCGEIVRDAPDEQTGQRLATAAILSAFYLCE